MVLIALTIIINKKRKKATKFKNGLNHRGTNRFQKRDCK